MALESFYGGKPGVSPVIRGKFKFIDKEDPAYISKIGTETVFNDLSPKEQALIKKINPEFSENSVTWNDDYLKPFTMDECFKDPTYQDIWYNELCIIDTESKSNPNNGKLFRRTLKRVDTVINAGDTSYAEYIGQIIGPSGGIPNLQFGSTDSVRKQAAGLAPTIASDGDASSDNPLSVINWEYLYPTDQQGNIINSFENLANDPSKIAVLSTSSNNAINMVPGRTDEGNYNDEIKYTWCNVHRNSGTEQEDFWIYLGFDIPYTIFDISAEQKNYTYNGPVLEDNSNKNHPFVKEYKFYIPRGARGIGPEEIFIVGKDGKEKPSALYPFDSIVYDTNTDIYSIKNTQPIVPSEKTYWVAKWTLYNPKTENKEIIYQYLGPYKDIENISVDTNSSSNNFGNLSVKYSSDENSTLLGNISLPKAVRYENGKFIFTYSDNRSFESGPIHEIASATIEDGYLKLTYKDGSSENVGLVIHNPRIISTFSLPEAYNTINALITKLNSGDELTVNNTSLNNEEKGTIKVNGIDQSSNFIGVKKDDETFVIYYDPTQNQWINGGSFGGSSSQGSNIHIQVEENNIIPSENDTNVDFTFINIKSNESFDPLEEPWTWLEVM